MHTHNAISPVISIQFVKPAFVQGGLRMGWLPTVSYTHLDVYKRQLEDVSRCQELDRAVEPSRRRIEASLLTTRSRSASIVCAAMVNGPFSEEREDLGERLHAGSTS